MSAQTIRPHQIGDRIWSPADTMHGRIVRFVSTTFGPAAEIEFETGAIGYVPLARLEPAPTGSGARECRSAGVSSPRPSRRPALRLVAVDGVLL